MREDRMASLRGRIGSAGRVNGLINKLTNARGRKNHPPDDGGDISVRNFPWNPLSFDELHTAFP